MATLTVTVPTAIANRVMDAITAKYGYQAIINGVPNPQTKQEFVRQWLISVMKAAVKEQETNTAVSAAFNNASIDVDNNINIT